MYGPVVVTRTSGRWYVSQQGATTFVIADYRRKAHAVIAARAVAIYASAELVVHKMNGRIQYRNSYGADSPRRPG